MLFKGVVMPGFMEEAWQELRSRRMGGIFWRKGVSNDGKRYKIEILHAVGSGVG